ncbi:hypothetical protein EI94DRAFT_1808561 [Lactarius quietus]|nr:hypothetical protein EI94DRAFT_1808561 [Lactarius quietus]
MKGRHVPPPHSAPDAPHHLTEGSEDDDEGGAGTGAEGGVVVKGGDSDSDSNFEDESGESDGRSGSSRPNNDTLLCNAWPQIQASLQNTLHALSSPPTHTKCKHSPSPSSVQVPTSNKKSKHKEEEDGEGDPPHLMLHVRSLHLVHATTGAPIAHSTHAVPTCSFLLPTHSHATGPPQWTALLLAGDTPTPTPTAPRKNNSATTGVGVGKGKEKGNTQFELACLVPEAGVVPHLTLHVAFPPNADPTWIRRLP